MAEREVVTMTGACTIVSPNYLPFARTLSESYRIHHPDQAFFVLIVATLTNKDPFSSEPFTAVLLTDLPLSNLNSLAMKYDILELNTNVKPTFMKHLLATFALEKLAYLDPDICVYSPLTPVFDLLNSASVALTPHLTSPVPLDGRLPNEQDMLYNGTYNLGFIAVRDDLEAARMLDWWENRCLEQGFSEARTGLFVDQKWINLAPGFFPGVQLVRHPGCNMAYWNLHERSLSQTAIGPLVNGQYPLCFYHFSGIDLEDRGALSVHCNRFTLADRPDLQDLFDDYKDRVKRNRASKLDALDYGFDRFTDGTAVNRLARRIYSKHEELQKDQNPFDIRGGFFSFCRRHGLLSGKQKPGKSTWHEFDPKERRVIAVHTLLLLALRLLGPDRYELLMRYLSFITVLRNQSAFITDK
jgi:hypothetical protein